MSRTTEPCIRCGKNPASAEHDWLHCEDCWQDAQDEAHQALAQMQEEERRA